MSLIWLNPNSLDFPEPECALTEPNGLLAAGGDLNPDRLLRAYQSGIFPWYERFLDDGSPSPILWWCPQPRCVLQTEDVKVSKSLRKNMRNKHYQLSCDLAFSEVIKACAESRSDISGTWINPDMIDAYSQLHKLGFAHSIECWQEDQLIGGLYGIAIGKMFFGESMFSRKTDSSKMALVYLCALVESQGAPLIDCQVSNPHLESLGAKNMPLNSFLEALDDLCKQQSLQFPQSRIYAADLELSLFRQTERVPD